jgi:conserved domain protein
MEKETETVLEIEFQPVFDKWAWKVIKNELEPGFEFEYLKNSNANIIRVCFEFYVDENYLLSAFEKEKLEKLIKAINEKYGISKRWRANKYDHYHFLGNVFEIQESVEMGFVEDIERYQDGNYFRTKEEAEKYRDYIVRKSLEWHEKRGRDE